MFDLPVLTEVKPKQKTSQILAETTKVYIETYGCQMNVNDSEIVGGVLQAQGFVATHKPDDADVILLNTCAIRDNAERKIYDRLNHLKYYKKRNSHLVVGLLGCMAERLRTQLLGEKNLVDIVVGPDEYRKVPQLIESALHGSRGIAIKLSKVETYDDIEPLRTEGISAWISITRGCDKFCTYCVVPFTRGRERSRPFSSIVDEAKRLYDSGFREITLLGQNVDSYFDKDDNKNFADLLRATAIAVPKMRIRYTTSHPQDMSDAVIETMGEFDNISKFIHLPFQAGSNRILELMNRTYTIDRYMNRIHKIKEVMPNCALSTDIISGFPTETEEEHQETLNVVREVRFDGAFMFKYSPRENTKAWKMGDDISDEVKTRRLNEIIELQYSIAKEINETLVGTTEKVLVEGPSKRDASIWIGRTDTNKVTFFPHIDTKGYVIGDIVDVTITKTTSTTLNGEIN